VDKVSAYEEERVRRPLEAVPAKKDAESNAAQGIPRIDFSVAVAAICSSIPDRIAVSPNNNKIALAIKADGSGPIRVVGLARDASQMDLHLYYLREKQLIRLTSNGLCNVCPDFSPDGRYVVYCSGGADKESSAEIKVMRLGERSEMAIARGFWPDWSPRSDRIAFVAREKRPEAANETYRLCVTDSQGQDTFVVYESADLPVWGWDSAGKSLYYATPTENAKGTTIFSVNVETRTVQRVFELASPLPRPYPCLFACSPDSRYLALAVDSEHGDGIAILDLRGNKVQYLDNERADGFQSDVRDPKFSRSGILSVSFGYDPYAVFLYNCSEGGMWQRVKEIRTSKNDKGPGYWGNHAWLTINGKEKMLIGYGQTDERNDFYELHLIDAETGQLERNLTKEITPLLGDPVHATSPTP
jgi:Tol biopolymer transport system component